MPGEFIARNGMISRGNVVVTGSLTTSGSLTATGTITATTLVVQTITSSISSITGSTNFGSLSSNNHTFTGSVNISSSLTVASGSTTPTLTVASGLVGIGMNPVYKLDVGDAIRGLDILAGGNTFAYDGTIRARNAANNTNVLLHSNGSSYLLGGNVGIGTTSPSSQLHIIGASTNVFADGLRVQRTSGTNQYGVINYKGGGLNILAVDQSGANLPEIDFLTSTDGINTTTRMVIMPSGNVGIGTTSPASKFEVYKTDGSYNAYTRINLDVSTDLFAKVYMGQGLTGGYVGYDEAGDERLVLNAANSTATTQFIINNTEVMRLLPNGKLVIGAANTTYSNRLGISTASAGPTAHLVNTNNANGDTCIYFQMGANARNTASYYLQCFDTIDNMYIYGNGNIVNRNNSYGTLSDIALKENIIDATSKLDDLLQLKVRNFNLIDDEEKTKQIGFIAQEFEEVFPKMVDVDGKTGMKTIKTSVLVPMLVKAIQELTARVQELENK